MKRERRFQILRWHNVIISLCILFSLSFISCSTIKYVPVKGENIVITEVKEVVRDSIIYVEIEKESHSNHLKIHRDTLSVLDNRYSISTAKVTEGNLKHTLVTKQDSLPVKIVYKDILRVDSIYVEKPVIQEVEVPIRDNIFWYSIIGNVVFIALLAFKFARIIKKFISL